MHMPIFALFFDIGSFLHIPYSADAVQEWAALGLEWYAYELGADSEQVREMKDVMGSPRSHPVWGSKRELIVGGPGNLSSKV